MTSGQSAHGPAAGDRQLTNLQELDLRDNQLTALPPEIGQLKNLKELDLRDNPLPIPPEILDKTKEPEAIITWYLQNVLSGAPTRPLNEAKVILVGQGAVGKTSLVKRLLFDEFDPQEQKTEGIDHPALGRCKADGQEIKLNVWDFGGQEIMHATHQFFLTKRSLYLLVLDSRQSGTGQPGGVLAEADPELRGRFAGHHRLQQMRRT